MFTWFYLLNGKLLCWTVLSMWSSYITIYSLISKLNSSQLHVLLPTGRKRSKILLKKSRGERQIYVKHFCFPSSRTSDHESWTLRLVQFYGRLAQRPFCWSCTDQESGCHATRNYQAYSPSSCRPRCRVFVLNTLCLFHLLEQENSARCQKWIHVFRTIHEISTDCP